MSSLDRILPFLKPIEDLLVDPAVTEVMVNGGGRQVFVEGSIRSRAYDDRDGNKRYITEIIGQRVQFLGGRGGEAGASVQPAPDEPTASGAGAEDDDIPF